MTVRGRQPSLFYSSHGNSTVNHRNLTIVTALVVLGAMGCSATPAGIEETAFPIGMPPAITPTEIQWFPPTETAAAPAPVTLEPTAERKPGIGGLVLSDLMTSAAHWNISDSGEASVIVTDRGLTVSTQPGMPPVVSLRRNAIFDNMYIELTARPSLCRERDAYGLVFRAADDVAYYRLVAICNGTAAAERMSPGKPRVLRPPTATSDVPVGAPGEVRLGVWAMGSELRFFLNDRYQFTASDGNYAVGGVGVFAEAGGGTPVVVTFSRLSVHELVPVRPPATRSP